MKEHLAGVPQLDEAMPLPEHERDDAARAGCAATVGGAHHSGASVASSRYT